MTPMNNSITNERLVTFVWEWKGMIIAGKEISFLLFFGSSLKDLTIGGWKIETTDTSYSTELHTGDYYWTVIPTKGICSSGIWHFTVENKSNIRCVIEYPRDMDNVSGRITVRGKVENASENVIVKIRIDQGEWKDVDGGRNWSYDLNTKSFNNGIHTIETWADDKGLESRGDIEIIVLNETDNIIESWLWIILVVCIAAIGAAYYVIKHKNQGQP